MAGTVLELAALDEVVTDYRRRHQRLVLTNGVFDLLHVGHLRYLRAARALGDVLFVGVNRDSAVAALKPGRPLVGENERAELVAALDPVDHVVLFEGVRADELLERIRPDVYAKGDDYRLESLPEAAIALRLGARLAFIPLVPGHSTSLLLRNLRGEDQ